MPKFSRLTFPQAYLLCSYLLISSVPFFGCFLGLATPHAGVLIAVEIFFWLLLWCVFQRPAYFHWLLLPVLCALPAEIFLRLYFNQGISPHHLGLIAESSPREALEFLGTKSWLLVLISIGIFLWWYSLQIVTAKVFVWRHRSRWFCLALLSLVTVVFLYGEEFGYDSETADDEDVATTWLEHYTDDYRDLAPMLPGWLDAGIDKQLIGRSWPFGLAVQFGDFLFEHHYLNQLSEQSRLFRFHASSDSTPKIIVLVIGESSRYDRWSLNGYERNTTPLLQKEGQIVSFTDMVSAVAATRLSVPIIVSRKPATQSLRAGFSEKSFISAFKEAGFKTYWISNQMSYGDFDTPISVFAKEADVTRFLNLGGLSGNASFDQVLLAPLEQLLHDPAPQKLIVLHTLGNHWNYSHRHPDSFNVWLPSLTGMDNPDYSDRSLKSAMNNSYDNSIRYTDWFLSEVLGQLKARQQISALLYVSDHGQVLYDGSCKLTFHGHNTQYEFHIPAFMWYSPQYALHYPEKVEQLNRHQQSRLSTENIFHSLLDVAAVHYPDEHPERSFVSAQWQLQRRYVDSYGWSNYDDADFKGDCREVMDHHVPLKQEK